MKEILDRIGSYNLFNYLMPGALYLFYLQVSIPHDFSNYNLILVGFLAYSIGLFISRVGSVLIQPIFIKIRLIKFKEYQEYIIASEKDEKVEILSEQNNTYRSLVALLILVGLTDIIKSLLDKCKIPINTYILLVIGIVILIVFISAYRKQTSLIFKRIEYVLSKK